MKVKFLRKGVFTSKGKMQENQEVDLDSDEAKEFMDRGQCVPVGKVVEAPKVKSYDSKTSK